MQRIKRPAWILCNPRCGSSYLCELLNNTGRFEPVRKERAFGEWLKHYPSVDEFAHNPPYFNKCTRHQFVTLLGDMTREEFEFALSGVRYIVIHRKDLYAQAVSMYIAKCTDRYHVFSEDSLGEYLKQEVEFDEELMLKMYKNACGYPTSWSRFLDGAKYLEVYYEDLIADPAVILDRVCRHLEIQLTKNEIAASVGRHKLIPTTRPEAEEFLIKLKLLAPGNTGL